MTGNYQQCTFCVMDTSDPEIVFDELGVCNHCKNQKHLMATRGYKGKESDIELDLLVKKIKKESRNKEFDVVLGISGGVDSAYALYTAVNLGLRVLAVHVDAGWNSEVAVSNIQKLCAGLSVDLHTIVIDWSVMRDLQRAFILSGLSNLDIPQDHVFLAAVFKFASSKGIKFMINGSNFATEGIFPNAWEYDPMDYLFIKSVYKEHGNRLRLKSIAHLGFFEYYYYHFQIKKINILNYIDYSKSVALRELHDNFDWNYYGGKHFESRFTRFFQSYFTMKKYGYDKRTAHLSSLIVNEEITRETAINELETPPYDQQLMQNDLEYILKKTNVSMEEWNNIILSPPVSEDNYRNSKRVRNIIMRTRNYLKGFG